MNYSKPEVTVLGSAADVIQGASFKSLETADPQQPHSIVSDCEMDD